MAKSEYDDTIVVQDKGNSDFLAGLIASGANQRGLDAGSVLAMCRGGGGFGGGFDINGLIGLVVVASLFGNNGGGLFGGGNNRNVSAEQTILDALNRNGIDMGQMANTLRCSIGDIMVAVQNVASSIGNVSNQVGLTGQQTINAIQQGNMGIIQQLCNCCCDLKSIICNQTNLLQGAINDVVVGQERGFSSLGYATREQTCAIEKAIAASTEAVLAGQRAAEMREMQREITERDRRIAAQETAINNYQQTQTFAQMIGSAINPVTAALNVLNNKVAGIECRLPETKVIPCNDDYVRVNRDVTSPYELVPRNCNGYPYGRDPYGLCANNGGWG